MPTTPMWASLLTQSLTNTRFARPNPGEIPSYGAIGAPSAKGPQGDDGRPPPARRRQQEPSNHWRSGWSPAPQVSPRITVSGHVYDVETGLVATVVGPVSP
jgi:hypothetical protein